MSLYTKIGGFPQFFFTELRIKVYEKIRHSNVLKLYMKIKKHEILNKKKVNFFSIRLEKNYNLSMALLFMPTTFPSFFSSKDRARAFKIIHFFKKGVAVGIHLDGDGTT